ncbi:MAG: hypothetical protein NDI69_04040 [Bacteriovoracaceae bacterium]|nr:hypothetical protein [Bacteriovoracaceae bacterium]
MNRAWSSLLIFAFASLLVSFPTFAQERTVLSENIYRQVRAQEHLKLTHLFRLFPEESRQMEIVSLSITARGFQGRTQLQVLQNGRVLLGGLFGMQTTELRLPLPPRTMIDDLLLTTRGDLYIETIRAEVRRTYGQHPERIYLRQDLAPYSFLDLGPLRPYENRFVTAITIEAYTRYSPGQLQLTTRWGEVIGSIYVSHSPMRPRIQLMRPLPFRDLQIRSVSSGLIELETLEIEF